jgi:hypothetical protein
MVNKVGSHRFHALTSLHFRVISIQKHDSKIPGVDYGNLTRIFKSQVSKKELKM